MKLTAFIFFAVLFCMVPAFGQNDDVQSFTDRANRLRFGKKYDEAVVEIGKAIEIQPSNPDLYLRRASLYEVLKNKKGVLEDVLKAISLKPKDMELTERGASYLTSSDQYEESLRIAENLIASKDYGRYYGYRIRCRNKVQLKDYAGAFDDVVAGRSISAAVSEGSMSKILHGLKDDSDIEERYAQLFENLDVRKLAFGTMASLYRLRACQTIVYADYASYYEEKRTPAETKNLFAKYEKDLGLDMRADIYEKMEKHEAAINDLTQLINSSESKTSYQFKRAKIYFSTDQFEKAMADYEEVKKVFTNFEYEINEKIAEARRRMNENANQSE